MKKYRPSRSVFVYAIVFLLLATLSYLLQAGIIYVIPPIAKMIEFVFLASTTMFIVSLWVRITSNRVYNSFEKELDMNQRIMLTNLYKIFWYVMGAAVVLYLIGVQASEITLIIGLMATGIAFAIRDVILSFFAWLIILNKKPFQHNDIISLLDGTNREGGQVKRIGMFFVTANVHGQLTRIPNKLFLDKMIKVNEKGIVIGELKLKLDKKPKANWHDKIKPLLKKYEATAHLDSDGSNIWVVIGYTCKFNEEQKLRTTLIELV